MKITVEHSPLNKALSAVQSIAGQNRSSVQVLTHVMIEAKDNLCTLTTTDLDMQAKSAFPAIVKEQGAITVPAHLLFGMVRSLPEGAQIDFTLGEDEQLSLTDGKTNFSLHTLPVSDFPKFDSGAFPHEFEIEANALRFLIEKTRFAISADETRYYLNGIYFHVPAQDKKDNQNILRSVATDGHQLALCDISLPEGIGNIPGIIVPRKTITELQRLIEDKEDNIKIQLSKTMVCFESENTKLMSKLIDGSFPDYARVIPDNNDKVLALDKKDLHRALQRVAALYTKPPPLSTPLVKLALNKDALSLSSVLSGRGSSQEEIETAYKGEAIEIGFNPTYLLGIIDCLDDEVQIKMASPDVAAILESAKENKTGKLLYVLMPMRV